MNDIHSKLIEQIKESYQKKIIISVRKSFYALIKIKRSIIRTSTKVMKSEEVEPAKNLQIAWL